MPEVRCSSARVTLHAANARCLGQRLSAERVNGRSERLVGGSWNCEGEGALESAVDGSQHRRCTAASEPRSGKERLHVTLNIGLARTALETTPNGRARSDAS